MTYEVRWKNWWDKDKALIIKDEEEVILDKLLFEDCRTCIELENCGSVIATNIEVRRGNRSSSEKWGTVFDIGAKDSNEQPDPARGCGQILIDNLFCYTLGAPSASYPTHNRDCILHLSQHPGGLLRIQNSVLGGSTDGLLDANRSTVTILENIDGGPSHRQIRCHPGGVNWPGAVVYHKDVRLVDPGPGHVQLWTGEPGDVNPGQYIPLL